jgi:GDP-L-fucose synthase
MGGIQANMREPVSFLMENLDMGRNVVWGARQAGIKRLINLGSSCMYPRNHTEPLSEELVLQGGLEPTNEGYALAKIVTARLCDYIVREDASFQYKTAIIHKVHLAKQTSQQTIEIWGDGNARREFMYAGDFADAVITAVNKFESLPTYMNVGLGNDFTINEYYQAVADMMGYSGNFAHDLSKPVGMTRKLLSVERQMDWGWHAKSDLRIGVEKTYAFYLKESLQ